MAKQMGGIGDGKRLLRRLNAAFVAALILRSSSVSGIQMRQ